MDVMEILRQVLEYIGPLIVAALTVPIYGQIKKSVTILDSLPDIVQKGLVVIIAGILAAGGEWLNVKLPTDLHLFQTTDVSAVLGGAWAWAIHHFLKKKALTTAGG
jgi:hypothetical protein